MRDAGEMGRRGGIWGVVFLMYAAMSLPEALGVVSAKLGVQGCSSLLFFLWFAFVPVPAGLVCRRLGSGAVARAALVATAAAGVALGLGGGSRTLAFAGLALGGLANTVLQVAVPACLAERVPSERLASVLTCGLFVRMIAAALFPFAVAWAVALGYWSLALVPPILLSALACAAVPTRIGKRPVSTGMVLEAREKVPAPESGGVLRVLADPVVMLTALAFGLAVTIDVAFNLSVPSVVMRRFGAGDTAVATVYACLFGVKLPVTLLGAWWFARREARRAFAPSMLAASVGAALMFASSGFAGYLVGTALFAAGFANIYGFVFGIAAPRHPDAPAAVSSVLVTAIAAGALASPLLAAASYFGSRSAEGLALALTLALLFVSVFVGSKRILP